MKRIPILLLSLLTIGFCSLLLHKNFSIALMVVEIIFAFSIIMDKSKVMPKILWVLKLFLALFSLYIVFVELLPCTILRQIDVIVLGLNWLMGANLILSYAFLFDRPNTKKTSAMIVALSLFMVGINFIPFSSDKSDSLPGQIGSESYDKKVTRLSELYTEPEMKTLKEVFIDKRNFDHIPDDLYTLTSITSLSITGLDTREIKNEIQHLASMEKLVIRGDSSEQLNEAFFGIKGLKRLTIGDSNLKKIPDQIAAFSGLEELAIHNTKLEEVSEKLWELNSLYKVTLSNGALKELKIKQLNSPIHELILSNNNLEEIPAVLYEKETLETLTLNNNNIKKLNKELIFSPGLRILNFSGNNITLLPDGLLQSNIQYLSLENTGMETVPTQIYAMPKLIMPSLKWNPIKDFDPQKFRYKEILQGLNIDSEVLDKLPTNAFSGYKNLIIATQREYVNRFDNKELKFTVSN
jgi:Leucine-rich repeat (LRR) protein